LPRSDYQCWPNNKYQLLSIDQDAAGLTWGFTFWDSNKTFMSSGKIGTQCPGSPDLENCKQHNTAHEIGHQFEINICSGILCPPANDPCGHCNQLAWCSNPPTSECNNQSDRQCPMYSDTLPQRNDGIERFEINDLFLGYCPYQPDSIRKAVDPK
jgi:hypothetical protein